MKTMFIVHNNHNSKKLNTYGNESQESVYANVEDIEILLNQSVNDKKIQNYVKKMFKN